MERVREVFKGLQQSVCWREYFSDGLQQVKFPFNVIPPPHYIGLEGTHLQLGPGDSPHALHLRKNALPDVTSTHWQLAISV